jgi:hypothetical protein
LSFVTEIVYFSLSCSRIKVNNSDEVLVVPLEVQVASNTGLYAMDDVLDFGIGGSQDKPKEVRLLLYNSWKKVIRIQVCHILSLYIHVCMHEHIVSVNEPYDCKHV